MPSIPLTPAQRAEQVLQREAAERLRATWYGYEPGDKPSKARIERAPGGRRRYTPGPRIFHSDPGSAPLPVPPPHDVGQARLRAILEAWRTPVWAAASKADDANRGGVRRLLVAAGMALRDSNDDGRERADALVQKAASLISGNVLCDDPAYADRFIGQLAALPKGSWRVDLCGATDLTSDPPPVVWAT
ncbi:hypothetical protein MKK55_18620 [Methylobacterium sp. J-059]|uniref:hypothetical protein n=1 Tax=Methylobacterium sp. J-059 TaxID=2836643 RepID=UPI001FB8E6DD|nr:hypothetical protein [Methylobacterium sp. J-059]MCJ2040945.1 hypothetical protein [Methylobacterium sp. J-059]